MPNAKDIMSNSPIASAFAESLPVMRPTYEYKLSFEPAGEVPPIIREKIAAAVRETEARIIKTGRIV